MKTMVQCDFDGTITEEDVSFFLLDTFADGDWRQLWKDYVGLLIRRRLPWLKPTGKPCLILY